MLRQLFPAGSLIFHDTMHGYPAHFRPFLHAYGTATLMAEGVSSNGTGLAWQWPRYATSQFRKSNAFGACKCSGWRGEGISPPASSDNYELAQLVYGGRQRHSQASARYDEVLHQLELVWRDYGGSNQTIDTFYDQYYLPAAQRYTGLAIGRSPMPIVANVTNVTRADCQGGSDLISVQLTVFQSAAKIRWSTDGSTPTRSSALYTHTLALPRGSQLHAVGDVTGLDLSRELVVNL